MTTAPAPTPSPAATPGTASTPTATPQPSPSVAPAPSAAPQQPAVATGPITIEQVVALMEANNKALLEQLKPKPPKPAADPNEDPKVAGLRNAIAVMHQANMVGLTDTQKQLVATLAGDDIVRQVEVLAALRQAGVLSPSSAPPSSSTPAAPAGVPVAQPPIATGTTTSPHAASSTLDLSGGKGKKPQTLAEADAAFIQAIAAKRR